MAFVNASGIGGEAKKATGLQQGLSLLKDPICPSSQPLGQDYAGEVSNGVP